MAGKDFGSVEGTQGSRDRFSVKWNGRLKPAVIATAEKDSISMEEAGVVQEMEGTAMVHITSDPPTKKSRELFSVEWAERVNQTLSRATDENKVANNAPPMHVPKLLQSGNPSAYVPRFVTFGPYHYHSNQLKVDYSLGQNDEFIKISAREAYKVNFAVTDWQSQLRINISAKTAKIKSMVTKIGSFYRWPIPANDDQYVTNFALMMMVDSLFLIQFLLCQFHDHGHHRNGIMSDILKLENQIPLFVVKRILKLDEDIPVRCESSKLLLQRANKELSPFHWGDAGIPEDALDEPHLLGCIHAIVSPFLKIEPHHSPKPTTAQTISLFLYKYMVAEEGLPIETYTAEELQRAGIKFRSFSGLQGKIWFDKCSQTLYLPRMRLSSIVQTEVFFRNMVALEFVDTDRPDTVTRFIQLMHCLINTPEDVQVLRKSHVITTQHLLSDEDIAGIWHSLRKPFSYGHVDPPSEIQFVLNEVLKRKYYRIKVRVFFWETCHYYYKNYFSTPWSALAFLFALFLLTVNMVQAYCSLWGCKEF